MKNHQSYLGKAIVISCNRISKSIFQLKIKISEKIKYYPGQFMRIKSLLSWGLWRPFSIADYTDDTITIYFKKVGKNTEEYSKLKSGDKIQIQAPHGNTKTILETLGQYASFILVGGGAGIFGIMSFAKWLSENNKQCKVLLGAKDLKNIPLESSLDLHEIVKIQDSDGFVTDLLEKELITQRQSIVIACGPNAMLKKVSTICQNYNNEYFAVVEEIMACGIGACHGCAILCINNTVKLVCKDGPIFDGKIIDWEKF